MNVAKVTGWAGIWLNRRGSFEFCTGAWGAPVFRRKTLEFCTGRAAINSAFVGEFAMMAGAICMGF